MEFFLSSSHGKIFELKFGLVNPILKVPLSHPTIFCDSGKLEELLISVQMHPLLEQIFLNFQNLTSKFLKKE